MIVGLPEWQTAHTVKINPDSPQRPVRAAALRAGKVLFLPCPKLAEEKPFLRLDPAELPEKALWKASSIKGAFELGTPVTVDMVEQALRSANVVFGIDKQAIQSALEASAGSGEVREAVVIAQGQAAVAPQPASFAFSFSRHYVLQ